MKTLMTICVSITLLFGSSNLLAAITEVVVTEISSGGTKTIDKWYQNGTASSGVASVVELTGVGGNLENNQPSRLGAAKLTTVMNNSSKAEIGTFRNFGNAASVLNDIELNYSYYRENLQGGNTSAAPAIKLTISKPGYFGTTKVGTLIYEPYWNGTVNSGNWYNISIDSNTGSGSDASGGWWWNGGFNISSGSAGPPIRSLSEWAIAFEQSDQTSFANATVTSVSIGIGTYNQGVTSYFDNVHIVTGNINTLYNFAQVPEPATLALLGLGGLFFARKKK